MFPLQEVRAGGGSEPEPEGGKNGHGFCVVCCNQKNKAETEITLPPVRDEAVGFPGGY